MSIIQGTSKGGLVSDYTIDQSLRFNDDDSAYLSRTPSVVGNRKTWTFSTWAKLSQTGTNLVFLSGGSPSTNMRITGGKFDFYHYSGGYLFQVKTTRVFRDYSSWYHFLVVLDTTQATASDRIKIYINGELETSFDVASYPSQNSDWNVNTTVLHNLGYVSGTTQKMDGYLAETHFIDGQALTPDNFGEFDETYGHWKPIAYDGTYGTNGFYLDNSGLGTDVSGNSNNFTATNLATTDIVKDSPTNNFATLNPLVKPNGSIVFQQGNLMGYTSVFGQWNASYSTVKLPTSGKWYIELMPFDVTNNGNDWSVGISSIKTNTTSLNLVGYSSDSYGYFANGNKATNSSQSSYGSAYTRLYIVGILFDADNGTLSFTNQGVSQGVAFTGLIDEYVIVVSGASYSGNFLNFGQDSSFAGNKTPQGYTDANGIGDFYYEPPEGYLALCTANLPEPTVVPSEHFNVVTYAGNSANNTQITVGLQPDFTWIKTRTVAWWHYLVDSVRGIGTGDSMRAISTNSTNAEYTAENDQLREFNTDGFIVDDNTDQSFGVNLSGQTYVAWNWKAGGTAVTNTDGSITSQVSANVDAGFSIVSWTSDGSAGDAIGHGLSKAPEIIIQKSRSTTSSWLTYTTAIDGTMDFLYLDTTAAKGDSGYSVPNTSTFIDGLPNSTATRIAYCFHSVEGYSKIGTYTGNGSTDGTFVYCGFRPRYVMIKCTSQGNSYQDWFINDTERDTYNISGKGLRANEATAEFSSAYLDFISNGFKLRASGGEFNASGATYLFIAFAETPFKYSNGR